MINLNEKKFEETSVFNNGRAGLATNVELQVEKREADAPSSHPDYKLFAVDVNGAKISQGFYVYKNKAELGDEGNKKRLDQEISRLVHVARAVMGEDYTLPEVESVDAAYKTVFKLINDNTGSKKFNVFATYGSINYPSKYLNMRYFNFVEPATDVSKFKIGNQDNMERLLPDSSDENMEGAISKTKTSEDWI